MLGYPIPAAIDPSRLGALIKLSLEGITSDTCSPCTGHDLRVLELQNVARSKALVGDHAHLKKRRVDDCHRFLGGAIQSHR